MGTASTSQAKIGPVRRFLLDQLSALYVQHGIEAASDDVTGAWLDPALVREGRAVKMKFFSDMGVYEIVPRSEQLEASGKVIGAKCTLRAAQPVCRFVRAENYLKKKSARDLTNAIYTICTTPCGRICLR